MSARGQLTRVGSLLVIGVAAAEVLIMISPFAGFFYATINFGGVLGLLSRSPGTAWLDGFFLNHSVITSSALLEWQREIGIYLFILGTLGFFVSAAQVYGTKIRQRGVVTESLYTLVRHPQYLCLGVAGWGLLTAWPRFLLLGIWVTMLFLYAGLARFEERRMEERFGPEYTGFAATRGAFLPGSPARRLFEATFGKVRPRALGWAVAYAFCLTLAFSVGFGLRAYTRARSALLLRPEHKIIVVSVWPQPQEWMARVFEAAWSSEEVQRRLEEGRDGKPLVASILPPEYGMKGMYYKTAGAGGSGFASDSDPTKPLKGGFDFPKINRIYMGVDPNTSSAPVEVVFSRAEKPYKEKLALEEALDPGVRLIPLVVVDLLATSGEITRVRLPLPQNAWDPDVVMPIF